MPNPRAMVEGLLLLVNRIKELDEDSVIMVSSAGRASIYIATLALLLGLHVRVGMEDVLFRYPHKDQIIKSNVEEVESIIEIAKQLGRRPAIAKEYRDMISIK